MDSGIGAPRYIEECGPLPRFETGVGEVVFRHRGGSIGITAERPGVQPTNDRLDRRSAVVSTKIEHETFKHGVARTGGALRHFLDKARFANSGIAPDVDRLAAPSRSTGFQRNSDLADLECSPDERAHVVRFGPEYLPDPPSEQRFGKSLEVVCAGHFAGDMFGNG